MPPMIDKKCEGSMNGSAIGYLCPEMLLQRSVFREYGIAILAVLSALLLRALMDPVLGDRLPYYLLYFAVMAAAAFGGLGPGLVTVAVGFIGATYFFAMPRYSLLLEDSEVMLSA